MIGVDVEDSAGHPSPPLRDTIIHLAFDRGLLLLPCGVNTIRFCPPLCLTERQVETGLELLAGALTAAVEGIPSRENRLSARETSWAESRTPA
jgi:4-aminobutyrate aminotransferase